MKKEFKTYKVFCNFCNKEILKENGFILPTLEKEKVSVYGGKYNSELIRSEKLVLDKQSVDLCTECQIKLARLALMIPCIENIDNGFTITYNTK